MPIAGSRFLVFPTFFCLSCLFFSFPVHAGVFHQNHWDTLEVTGWNYSYKPVAIDGSTGTPNKPNALRFTFPKGMVAGIAPSMVSYSFAPLTEFWWQYWFKYDPEWTWQTISDKQVYFNLTPDESGTSNSLITIGMFGNHKVTFVNQINWGIGTKNYFGNTGYNPTIQKGQWYKLTGHMVINTPGKEDGILQVWLNDQLVLDYNTIPYRSSSESGKAWGRFRYVPVWGGGDTGAGLPGDGPKPKDEYLWVDCTIISSDPIGSSTSTASKSPKPPRNMIIKPF